MENKKNKPFYQPLLDRVEKIRVDNIEEKTHEIPTVNWCLKPVSIEIGESKGFGIVYEIELETNIPVAVPGNSYGEKHFQRGDL
jgi:hypothetical protein